MAEEEQNKDAMQRLRCFPGWKRHKVVERTRQGLRGLISCLGLRTGGLCVDDSRGLEITGVLVVPKPKEVGRPHGWNLIFTCWK